MCRRSSGVLRRSSLVWWWGRCSVRGSTCLICLVLALSTPVWSETSPPSEPDWPELMTYLDVIDSGLSMTESASSEIETSQQQREQLLIETEQSLDEREDSLSQREVLLDEREQGLNGQEQDLQQRESSYGDMQMSLDAANERLDEQKIRKWFFIAGAGVVFGYLGYRAGKALR